MTSKLLGDDSSLIERVASRVNVGATGRPEDDEYQPKVIRRGERFLRKLVARLKTVGLTPFERQLYTVIDKQKELPLNWNLKQNGGDSGDPNNMRLLVGGIHTASIRDLMGDVDATALPSKDSYFTFKHESGHIADYVSNVPGLNWTHPTQLGIITHRRLYAEFRANLWASNGQFDLAFQRTWATYGLKDFITRFDIQKKSPEEVYFILKTLSEKMADHVTPKTISVAREIVEGPLNREDATPLGKLLGERIEKRALDALLTSELSVLLLQDEPNPDALFTSIAQLSNAVTELGQSEMSKSSRHGDGAESA